ncbi:MAG TPA: HAD family phosphatase [Nocardioidaceae bacterium]
MAGVRAVVFDIGGVLERVDDDSWPTTWIRRWERRANRPEGYVLEHLAEHAPDEDVVTGRMSEDDIRRAYADVLGLQEEQADAMMAEMWDAYCGELDVPMRDFAASLRPTYRTGILSNSADGAWREEQRRYGFEELVDVIVYSHEVGLAKPDPQVFQLTEARLGVEPFEIVLVDDQIGHVEAARRQGWQAVLHRHTPASIRDICALIGR